MKKNNLIKQLTLFLGLCSKKGATKEELDTIIKTIDIVKKYLPSLRS